jgi:hypothetical protein
MDVLPNNTVLNCNFDQYDCLLVKQLKQHHHVDTSDPLDFGCDGFFPTALDWDNKDELYEFANMMESEGLDLASPAPFCSYADAKRYRLHKDPYIHRVVPCPEVRRRSSMRVPVNDTKIPEMIATVHSNFFDHVESMERKYKLPYIMIPLDLRQKCFLHLDRPCFMEVNPTGRINFAETKLTMASKVLKYALFGHVCKMKPSGISILNGGESSELYSLRRYMEKHDLDFPTRNFFTKDISLEAERSVKFKLSRNWGLNSTNLSDELYFIYRSIYDIGNDVMLSLFPDKLNPSYFPNGGYIIYQDLKEEFHVESELEPFTTIEAADDYLARMKVSVDFVHQFRYGCGWVYINLNGRLYKRVFNTHRSFTDVADIDKELSVFFSSGYNVSELNPWDLVADRYYDSKQENVLVGCYRIFELKRYRIDFVPNLDYLNDVLPLDKFAFVAPSEVVMMNWQDTFATFGSYISTVDHYFVLIDGEYQFMDVAINGDMLRRRNRSVVLGLPLVPFSSDPICSNNILLGVSTFVTPVIHEWGLKPSMPLSLEPGKHPIFPLASVNVEASNSLETTIYYTPFCGFVHGPKYSAKIVSAASLMYVDTNDLIIIDHCHGYPVFKISSSLYLFGPVMFRVRSHGSPVDMISLMRSIGLDPSVRDSSRTLCYKRITFRNGLKCSVYPAHIFTGTYVPSIGMHWRFDKVMHELSNHKGLNYVLNVIDSWIETPVTASEYR